MAPALPNTYLHFQRMRAVNKTRGGVMKLFPNKLKNSTWGRDEAFESEWKLQNMTRNMYKNWKTFTACDALQWKPAKNVNNARQTGAWPNSKSKELLLVRIHRFWSDFSTNKESKNVSVLQLLSLKVHVSQ